VATRCPKCQTENPETARFCLDCGTQLSPPKGIEASVTKTLETTPDELARGTLFVGRYEIIEELGAGGMGRVYRAFDKKIEDEVALKLLKPEIAADKKTIDRFRNELKLARKIRHSNVCAMFDLGEERRTLFISMEYVRGEDLKSLLHRTKTLPIGTALSIARQVAEGLAEAHKLGITHRDLKTGNIMIDKEGNAKIMDFGIARSLMSAGTTAEGTIIGTPEYMSPEQVEGKPADARSDLYSLGVILFEMVTGHPPFEGETSLAIAHKHKYEPAPDPRSLNPQLPADVARLILRCLEKVREKRFQTAAEFLTELSAVEETLPKAERTPAGFPLTRRKPIVSKTITAKIMPRRLLIAASLVLLLAVAAILFFLLRPKKDLFSPTLNLPSLAVLPFENLTGSAELDHWKDMLPELLVSDLLQSKYLNVMTRDSAYDVLKSLDLDEAKKFSRKDLERFAKETRMGHIATGSYLKAGDQFIINLTVQDFKTRKAIKPMRIECRNEGEIIAKTNEMTAQIKSDLELSQEEISSDFDEDVSWITTSNPEALRCYIEAVKYSQIDQSKSIEWGKKAVALDPEFAMAYKGISAMAGNLGYYKESEEAIAKASEFKDRISLRERLGIEAFAAPDIKTAIEKSQQILKLYPLDRFANVFLANIYAFMENWEKALEYNETLIRNGVHSTFPYENSIALCYLPMGIYDKALELVERAPESIRKVIIRMVPYIYLNKGDFRRALEEEQKLAHASPPAYWLRGHAFYLMDDFKQAEENYKKLVEAEDLSVRAFGYNLLHFIYKAQGKFTAAEKEAARLSEIAESAGQPYWEYRSLRAIAVMHISAGDLPEAKEIVDKWLKRLEDAELPLDSGWAYCKTWVEASLKSFGQAKKALGEVKVLSDKTIQDTGNPKFIRYHDWLKGVISLEENDLSGAVSDLENAVGLFPVPYLGGGEGSGMGDFNLSFIDYADYLNPLARAYFESGDLEKARKEYEKIIGLSAGRMYSGDIYARSFYMLGKIFEQQGKKGKARDSYRKFLDLWKDADSGLPEVDDAGKRLAGLKGP
jgi:tetratricopeptide (TPR) repeat protein